MDFRLKAGDRILIPTDCKAIIKDNNLIVIEEKKEFKDGDILCITLDGDKKCPFIYKGLNDKGFYLFYAGIDINGNVISCPPDRNAHWGDKWARHATEEEKQDFFDELRKRGLYWDAETKQMGKLGPE